VEGDVTESCQGKKKGHVRNEYIISETMGKVRLAVWGGLCWGGSRLKSVYTASTARLEVEPGGDYEGGEAVSSEF